MDFSNITQADIDRAAERVHMRMAQPAIRRAWFHGFFVGTGSMLVVVAAMTALYLTK